MRVREARETIAHVFAHARRAADRSVDVEEKLLGRCNRFLFAVAIQRVKYAQALRVPPEDLGRHVHVVTAR